MDVLGRAPSLACPNQTVHILNQRHQYDIKEQLDGGQVSHTVVPNCTSPATILSISGRRDAVQKWGKSCSRMWLEELRMGCLVQIRVT